jgi:hypothetical protein
MVTFLRMNCVLTSKLSPVLISLLLLPILLPRHPNPPKIEAVNFIPNMVVPVVVDAPTFLEAEAPLNFLPATSGSSRAFCQICFKVGHTAQACWHRFDQNFQVSSNQSPQAFAASTSSTVDPAWYPDTGANNHITADYGNLNLHAEDYTGQDQVRIGNGQGLHIHHIGSSILCSSNKNFFLNNILHVPHISQNLLSVYQFTKDNNVFFEFHPSFFCVKDLFSGVTLLSGKSKNGLYPLHSLQRLIKPTALLGERVSVEQWHSRLGHPALRIVRQVLSSHHLPISKNKTLPSLPRLSTWQKSSFSLFFIFF